VDRFSKHIRRLSVKEPYVWYLQLQDPEKTVEAMGRSDPADCIPGKGVQNSDTRPTQQPAEQPRLAARQLPEED